MNLGTLILFIGFLLSPTISMAAEQKTKVVGFLNKGAAKKVCFVGIDSKTLRFYATFPKHLFTKNQQAVMNRCQQVKDSKFAHIAITRVHNDQKTPQLSFLTVTCEQLGDRESQDQLLSAWRKAVAKSEFTECL